MAKKSRNELYYQVKKGCGLEELTLEQIGTIFLSLEKYDGTRQHFDDVAVRLVYKQLCDHIDQENGRYEDIREKRRQASHARQAVKDKQMMLDSTNDNQMTSNDNTCNQMMSQKHNHKQNTESETQSKSESESKTESQSEGKINLPPYRGEEEVRATDSFVSQCCSDRQWLEVIAMKTHLPIGKVIEKLKDADMTMIADGDYPKSINEYKARAHRIITNVKKEDNGNGKQRVRAADLL